MLARSISDCKINGQPSISPFKKNKKSVQAAALRSTRHLLAAVYSFLRALVCIYVCIRFKFIHPRGRALNSTGALAYLHKPYIIYGHEMRDLASVPEAVLTTRTTKRRCTRRTRTAPLRWVKGQPLRRCTVETLLEVLQRPARPVGPCAKLAIIERGARIVAPPPPEAKGIPRPLGRSNPATRTHVELQITLGIWGLHVPRCISIHNSIGLNVFGV